MEPERTSTHTHIERERRGGSGLAFIVGGLVVAVLVIAYFVFDGGSIMGGDADTSINVEATSESPAPAVPAGDGAGTQAAPAEGGAATETAPAPAAPAQN